MTLKATFKAQAVGVRIDPASMGLDIGPPIAVEHVPPYEGEYAITPSPSEQVLQTAGRQLAEDIRIAPIPSIYGLISYNGSYITVS